MDHLSRIYPAGWRTDSSNYSPVEMWNGGCQIGMVWLRLGGALGEGFCLEGQGPLRTQQSQIHGFVGFRAGNLSLEISPTRKYSL